jgi:hypothetical protein
LIFWTPVQRRTAKQAVLVGGKRQLMRKALSVNYESRKGEHFPFAI